MATQLFYWIIFGVVFFHRGLALQCDPSKHVYYHKQLGRCLQCQTCPVGFGKISVEDSSIDGIFHWSGNENMTKYDMSNTMAEVFNLPLEHIKADKQPSGGAARPFNSQLSCQRLKDLGVGRNSLFKEQIYEVLKPHFKS